MGGLVDWWVTVEAFLHFVSRRFFVFRIRLGPRRALLRIRVCVRLAQGSRCATRYRDADKPPRPALAGSQSRLSERKGKDVRPHRREP